MKNEQAYIIQLKNGLRFTTNLDLAIKASEATGRPVAEFISSRVREAYMKAYPDIFGPKTRKKTKAA